MIGATAMLVLSLAAPPPQLAPPAPLPGGAVVLQRFVRAVGGEAAIRDIEAMTVQGRIGLPGVAKPGRFRWSVADGGRCVFDMAFPDLGRSRFGSDGKTGWEIVELEDSVHRGAVPLDEVERRRRRANWFELALTLPARATEFTTIGRSTFDGIDAYEVYMVDASGRPHTLYFAADSSFLLGVRLSERGPAGPADVTIRFAEWSEVGPLTLFHRVSINHADVHLQLKFDAISLDPVPDAAFSEPADDA
ncbi:MAG: hypothetical protein QF733_02940 [Phycisphaerales bacterium]|jgi:hypothetical protein|nr:hypothetical protein [Phycisphaerales bacterium]